MVFVVLCKVAIFFTLAFETFALCIIRLLATFTNLCVSMLQTKQTYYQEGCVFVVVEKNDACSRH